MKAFAVFTLLLAASTAVQGARRLQTDGCSDLSVFDSYADFSEIVSLIKGLGLLPNGVPADATLFLPTNSAVASLLSSLSLTGMKVADLLNRGLPEGTTNQLVSTVLYHLVPSGAWEITELADEGTIVTALPDNTFEFGETFFSQGSYVITDGVAQEVDIASSGPVDVCGSKVYSLDKVLLPALWGKIPQTTPEQAVALLTGGGNSPAIDA